MNAAQTVRLMEKLKALGTLDMDHPGRGLASVEAMEIVHSSKVTAEQLATLFELQPKDSGLSTAQDFGIMMLWSLSMNSENFGATLALGHADLQREAPYFLSGPLSAISGYFCNNMAKEVCKDNPQNLPPSLIDEAGKISFDEKAYMQFHAHTLRSEIMQAMEDDPERFTVMVNAIKASPHTECFEETLGALRKHPSIKVLPINSPLKRVLMGDEISPEEIFGYIDHMASSITLGNIPLDQKRAILDAAHEGIRQFRALDEEAIAQYLDRKLNFSSNEDMKWELHDPHKSIAMLFKELDPTGILVARSYATYKGQEFSSIERVLESMVDEISVQLPGQYLGNRDVWLSGAILTQPPELLMSLKLKNEGWYKLYQLTESPLFKERVRGRHLDRIMGQDLGL